MKLKLLCSLTFLFVILCTLVNDLSLPFNLCLIHYHDTDDCQYGPLNSNKNPLPVQIEPTGLYAKGLPETIEVRPPRA